MTGVPDFSVFLRPPPNTVATSSAFSPNHHVLTLAHQSSGEAEAVCSDFRTPELQGTELLCPPPALWSLLPWPQGANLLDQRTHGDASSRMVLKRCSVSVGEQCTWSSTDGWSCGVFSLRKLVCTSLVEGPACSCTSGPPGLNSWEVAEIWTVVSLPGLPEPNSQLCAF